MRRSRIILICLLLVAAALFAASRGGLLPARYDPLSPLDLADAPNLVTPVKLWLIEGDTKACVAALRKARVDLKEMPTRTDRPGCTRQGTVTLSRLSQASFTAEEMGCDIALRLYLLERHDIQPLAQHHLGSAVERIVHFGSYSCRTIAGSSRMSEHATANAFDIAGFRLDDGRSISLKRDWTRGGSTSHFLKDLRSRACLVFNMVLSPDYNEAHADHYHVDMGWFMGCH